MFAITSWNYENSSFLENLKEQLTIKSKHESKLTNLSLILKE